MKAVGKRLLLVSALVLGFVQLSYAGGREIIIGVMNDQNGPYADCCGRGSVIGAQIAAEELGNKVIGKPVRVISGDHQNKPDIGSQIARKWFEVDGVDMVIDFPNSAVALAVQDLARERKKVSIVVSSATTAITGKACTPYSFHWAHDARSNAAGPMAALIKQGLDSFFFITVDYALGHSLEAESTAAIKAAGGTVVGSARHPLNTADFSSYLVRARASKAKVIVLNNAGNDTTNSIKQAEEFGLRAGGQTLMTPFIFISDVKSLGLKNSQGLRFLTAFYWDRDEQTRAFSTKFFERAKVMPTLSGAGTYSGVRHYLKAIEAAGTDDPDAVAKKMREMPVNDMYARNGVVRADGRMVFDMLLVEIKKPEESKVEWDYYKILATLPGKTLFTPLEQSACPLVKK